MADLETDWTTSAIGARRDKYDAPPKAPSSRRCASRWITSPSSKRRWTPASTASHDP